MPTPAMDLGLHRVAPNQNLGPVHHVLVPRLKSLSLWIWVFEVDTFCYSDCGIKDLEVGGNGSYEG